MYNLVPVPINLQILTGKYNFSKNIYVRQTPSYKLLSALENILELEVTVSDTPNLVLKHCELDHEEYKLIIDDGGITIFYGDENGIFYALMTFKQLLKKYNYCVPHLKIEDKPKLKFRGYMQDISRCKVLNVVEIKKLLLLLAQLKYNNFQLYIEGFSFEYQSFEKYLVDQNYITLKEYIEIQEFANDLYIDFIPNQNGLGHMEEWLKQEELHNLAECPEGYFIWGSNRISSTLDVSNSDSLELVSKMYEDMIPHTNSKYFNMNLDEPHELGLGKNKEKALEIGKENLYIEYFKKLEKIVKGYGKTPMMWADLLVKYKDCFDKLPKDIIYIDWGYNLDYPFDENSKLFEQNKVKFINASASSTWGVKTARYQDMIGSIKNGCTYALKHGGLGSIITDWGDTGHLQYHIFSYLGIVYGAMCNWNVDRAYENLIIEYINEFIFEEDEGVAEILVDLARYTIYEGEYRSYGSRLFSQILWAEHAQKEENKLEYYLDKMSYNILSKNKIQTLKSYFNMIQTRIDLLNDSLTKQMLNNSVYLLNILLRINETLARVIETKEKPNISLLYNELDEYLVEHKIIWNAFYKRAGYKFSAQRIQDLQKVLKWLQI